MADVKSGYGSAKFNPLDFPQSLELPKRIGSIAWHEHIPFVKVLVQLLRPKILVKLGVNKDDSYLAVCEAAAALGITCYGIETGGGVRRAGVADKEILSNYRASHDALYGNFSRLMETPSRDAAAQFTENSVELLYIDGLQTYENVGRDWETWRSKLSRRGVVLFQGTNVHEEGFGMWRLWKEICPVYRHFEFLHAQGLGILVTGPGTPEPFNAFMTMGEENPEPIRKYFFNLGNQSSLRAQSDLQRKKIEELEAKLRDAESQIKSCGEIEKSLDAARITQATEIGKLTEKVAEHERTQRNLEQELNARDKKILERETAEAALKRQIEQLESKAAALSDESARLKKSQGFKLGNLLSFGKKG